jgi:membrane protein implicated in regulation of membrane protease activity
MNTMIFIWLAVAVILVVCEIFAPGFIFACFVVGAVAAGLSALITDSYLVQGAVFAIVSLGLIPLTRPLANRLTKPSPVLSNVDGLLGKTGYAKSPIDDVAGQVLVDGQVWQARSDAAIAPDRKIRVVAVEGAKLKIEQVNEQ